MFSSRRERPRGLLISSCFFGIALICLVFLVIFHGCSRTITDKDFEPKPIAGTPRPYRQTEFTGRVSGLEGVSRVRFSSLKDRVFFEGFTVHAYGPLRRPEQGWILLIPGEKLFLRMNPQREKDLWKARPEQKLGRVFQDYGLNRRSFPGFIQQLTTRPTPQGTTTLEQRGAYAVEVSVFESSRRGSMQEGFKLHRYGGRSEFCPELGVLMGQRGMQDGQWSSGFSLDLVSEEAIPDSLFRIPKGYSEL